MSEAIPGMPPAPPPARIRSAAQVILFRRAAEEGGSGVELYWLRRENTLSFAGGFYAFPGGRADAADGQIPVEGAFGDAASLRVTAARELLEEAGILKARGAEALAAPTLAEMRKSLLAEKQSFGELLRAHALKLDASDFPSAGRFITPASMPIRYDCYFFLVEVAPGMEATFAPGEHVEGAWMRPLDALEKWNQGLAILHPPALYALQVMAEFTDVPTALLQLENPPHTPAHTPTRIQFQRGVRVFPVETPTLPPATHTNVHILGNGELLIVDPGAAEVRQYARLLALVAGFKAEGLRPLAIVLTHHHADHIGGAESVKQRLGIPVWCHAKTADRLPFRADRLLEEGEVLTLQGTPPMRWRVLYTPGHARGHICLLDEASHALIAGDMVAGLGTILIDPPEGDMSDYLAQLARLRDLPVRALYPAHGPPMPDGPAKLTEYIRHRELREKKVVEAVKASAGTLAEISARAYSDSPTAFPPLAERSTQAILIKLTREGRVLRHEDHYSLKPSVQAGSDADGG